MKVEYKVLLEVTAVYEIDDLRDLRSNTEMAESMGTLICDEISYAGGTAHYDIKESKFEATGGVSPEWKENFEKRFNLVR